MCGYQGRQWKKGAKLGHRQARHARGRPWEHGGGREGNAGGVKAVDSALTGLPRSSAVKSKALTATPLRPHAYGEGAVQPRVSSHLLDDVVPLLEPRHLPRHALQLRTQPRRLVRQPPALLLVVLPAGGSRGAERGGRAQEHSSLAPIAGDPILLRKPLAHKAIVDLDGQGSMQVHGASQAGGMCR